MKWEGNEESENVEDRRTIGPKGLAVGGGAAILVLIGALFGINPEILNKFLGNAGVDPQGPRQEQNAPPTPEQQRSKKFSATVLRFTEDVWTEQFRKAGKTYQPPKLVLFSNSVQTACGPATSAVGPFYCPGDKTVYLDPAFFEDLERKLGGSKAEFSQAYVIAHEVGHHVQNLIGYSGIVDQKRQTESKAEYNRWSVRLELQADYLAGVWAHYAQQKFKFMEAGDLEAALKSANAIGDDKLSALPQGYTHGTSAQRVRWFRRGLETGDMSQLKKIFEMPYNEL